MRPPILSAERLLALPGELRRRPELRPLLHAMLMRADQAAGIDPFEQAAMRAEYLATLAQGTLLRARAIQILDEAERRGLRLLLLKGILFSEVLYSSNGARPMSDVDLGVEPEHLAEVVTMLEELGYRRLYPGRRRFSEAHRHGHDVAMVGHGANIELHHRLHHELGMESSISPFFARAIELDALEGRRWAPSWDDHLFYVAAHAATHALADTPVWIFDVALLVERGASIRAAQAEAVRRRASAGVWSALSVAHELLPDVVPAPEAPPGAWLRRSLVAGLLGSVPLADAPSQWRSLLVRVALTDSPWVAAREILRKARLRLFEAVEGRSASR